MDAPEFIAQDTYTGTHTVWGTGPKRRAASWTAGELAAHSREGVVFESFGHVNGREGFARTRFIADSRGYLHCYDSDGSKKCIHPANRELRILVG